MVNLCKGLGAPIGAILAGPESKIIPWRQIRRSLGGTLRQTGFMAAAGLAALQSRWEHLALDHARARQLAKGLCNLELLAIDPDKIDSNIVLLNVTPLGITSDNFAQLARQAGVAVSQLGPSIVRLVTHRDLTDADINQTIDVLASIIKARLDNGIIETNVKHTQ